MVMNPEVGDPARTIAGNAEYVQVNPVPMKVRVSKFKRRIRH